LVPDQRETPRHIGLGLVGSRIRLDPVDDRTTAEFARLNVQRQLEPLVGSTSEAGSPAIAPPMIVRDRRSGQAVGVVQNHAQPGGIAVLVVYLDPRSRRVGFGFEAIVLYVSHLFDSGARLVTSEVLEFNQEMNAIMRKSGLSPQARMREHQFIAGRYWDLLIYSLDRQAWLEIVDRYRPILPGGRRTAKSIGAPRPKF